MDTNKLYRERIIDLQDYHLRRALKGVEHKASEQKKQLSTKRIARQVELQYRKDTDEMD